MYGNIWGAMTLIAAGSGLYLDGPMVSVWMMAIPIIGGVCQIAAMQAS